MMVITCGECPDGICGVCHEHDEPRGLCEHCMLCGACLPATD